jgi:Succinylglutamate desuccinylase / Aspartoacylase family
VTTGLYHRFDGYEDLKALLEGSDEDVLVALADKPALIRIPAASTTAAPRGRLIACLMHGNEPSGFQAVVELLRRGDRFPFDLWVLIGNVRAAIQDGLYAHRHLDDQEDFNRIWDVGPATTRMRRGAAAILEELRSADLEAAVDLHNNSGRNPCYAILTQLSPEGLVLASLCADTMLHWKLRAHTLMEALATACPTVSVECGLPYLPEGTAFASGVIHRFLAAEVFAAPTGAELAKPQRMVETLHRVSVRPEVAFSFGAVVDGETDFVIVPGLDAYNFGLLPAMHTIGHIDPGAAMPLFAGDMAGTDVTDQLFRTTPDGRVIVAADIMPVMMTTTVQQARRDCLFYTSLLLD